MKSLTEIVLEQIADGHAYDKMSAHPPSAEQQREMARDELNNMRHDEFLDVLSSAMADLLSGDDDGMTDSERFEVVHGRLGQG